MGALGTDARISCVSAMRSCFAATRIRAFTRPLLRFASSFSIPAYDMHSNLIEFYALVAYGHPVTPLSTAA